MKNLRFAEQRGLAQIFIMIAMLILAVALPVATRLVQQNQETRSKAAGTCSKSNCSACTVSNCSTNDCLWNNGSSTCLNGDGSLASATCKGTSGTVKRCVGTFLYTCIAGSPQWTGGSPENCANGCENNACKGTTSGGSSGCKNDLDCPDHKICSSGKCVDSHEGYACSRDTQCPSTMKCISGKCGVKVNGACGTTKNTCTAGTVSDTTDSETQYKWNCTGTNGGTTANCAVNFPACTDANWSSTLSPATCPSSGQQTRTWTKSGTCSGGVTHDPTETVSCTYTPPACTDANWTSTLSPATCPSSGQQTRTWNKNGTCSGGVTHNPTETVSCTYVPTAVCTSGQQKCTGTNTYVVCDTSGQWGATSNTCANNGTCTNGNVGSNVCVAPICTSYTTTEWSACVDGFQTRTITGAVPSGCSGGAAQPITRQSCTVAVTPKISFRFSFAGVTPNKACISNLGNLKIEVGNSPADRYQGGLTSRFSAVSGLTDTMGNQVFEVKDLALDTTKFGDVNTNNYIKIKGPFHSKRRFCTDGQTGRVNNDTTICNINLKSGTVYDFAKYAYVSAGDSFYGLLAGDVNNDGVINSIDFSLVKHVVNPSAPVSCGTDYDLNADGVVNNLDVGLVKIALSSRDDE